MVKQMKINHSKYNLDFYYKFMIVLCIPFLVYGIFKNSIMVYSESKAIFLGLKPIISLCFYVLGGLFLDKKLLKRRMNKYLFSAILLWMILPVITPLWLSLIAFILLFFIIYKEILKINPIILTKLIIVIILFAISCYTYQNYNEASGKYLYSFIDLFYKNQVGGMATSNLILVTISFVIILFNPLYKKNIALSSLSGYFLTLLLFVVLGKDTRHYVELMILASSLFDICFLAPMNEYSSYTQKGQILFGFFVGIIGALFEVIFNPYEGIALAILLASILKNIFDRKFLLN